MTTWMWWAAGFFCGAVAEQYLGARLRTAGRSTADRVRYWWRRKRAVMRGEDPDAWRNEYVTVMVNGIPQNVHPDELEFAEHIRAYLAEGMRKLEAAAPAEDPREAP